MSWKKALLEDVGKYIFPNYNKKNEEYLAEMSNMVKRETGLPVNIWVDDGGYWLHAGHNEPRLKFQNNYGNRNQIDAQVPLIISDEPIIPESVENINIEISSKDLNMVKNFIKRYKNLLIKVGDPDDDVHTMNYFNKALDIDLSYAKSNNIKEPWKNIEYLNNFDNKLLRDL